MYDTDSSHTVLSQLTDRIIPEVKAWQNRSLAPVYCIVWLEAMHYKVRSEGKVEYKALCNILGINATGRKRGFRKVYLRKRRCELLASGTLGSA